MATGRAVDQRAARPLPRAARGSRSSAAFRRSACRSDASSVSRAARRYAAASRRRPASPARSEGRSRFGRSCLSSSA